MDLRGKKVLVVGLARTGLATVKFLKARGSIVSATEVKSREEMNEVAREVAAMGLRVEWGGHQTETFLGQDLIVVSPGVELTMEPVQEALRRGIPVISEMELAYRFVRAPLIAVTGTNGKTTTTLLTGEMLKEDGKQVGVGGNVGEPLIRFVEEKRAWDVLVVEVSSFQLEGIEQFRPKLSVLLNITEDHLDRYPRYSDYIEAKARIFMNQRKEDVALLNRDDPIVMKLAQRIEPERILFSLREELREGVSYRNQTIFLRLGEKEETYFIGRAPLKGVHNIENMMAAITAARLFDCSKRSIETVLGRFEGLEHRLELVREMDGVRFYNDSKGTNVGSVVKSLESFSEPVVLIAGGKDKEGDLSPLKALIRRGVKRLILIGEAKERMAKELGGLTDTTMTRTLEEAVLLAHQTAQKGEVVLLSPACSSFDMFKDYKERGRVFKEAVRRL